jgi:hypothetical protein
VFYVQRWCERWFDFLTSFTTRTSPKVLEWEHSKNTIMSAQYQRIMTKKVKVSRAPGSTKQILGQSDLYRGSAARLNHRPLNNPQVVRNGAPFHTSYEQQWFGSHIPPGNMPQINWRLKHHVYTATGLKYPWFDRACTHHYCGHILTPHTDIHSRPRSRRW